MYINEYYTSNYLYSSIIDLLENLNLREKNHYKNVFISHLDDFHNILTKINDTYIKDPTLLHDYKFIIRPVLETYIKMKCNTLKSSSNHIAAPKSYYIYRIFSMITNMLSLIDAHIWKKYGLNYKHISFDKRKLQWVLCEYAYKEGYFTKNEVYMNLMITSNDFNIMHYCNIDWLKE